MVASEVVAGSAYLIDVRFFIDHGRLAGGGNNNNSNSGLRLILTVIARPQYSVAAYQAHSNAILSSPTFFYTLHGRSGILPVEWLGLWNQP